MEKAREGGEERQRKINLIKKSNNQNLINLRQINYPGIKRRFIPKRICSSIHSMSFRPFVWIHIISGKVRGAERRKILSGGFLIALPLFRHYRAGGKLDSLTKWCHLSRCFACAKESLASKNLTPFIQMSQRNYSLEKHKSPAQAFGGAKEGGERKWIFYT